MGVSGNSVVHSEELRKWKKCYKKGSGKSKLFDTRLAKLQPNPEQIVQTENEQNIGNGECLKFLIVLWSIFDWRCFAHFTKNQTEPRLKFLVAFQHCFFCNCSLSASSGQKFSLWADLSKFLRLIISEPLKTYDIPSTKNKGLARKSFEIWAIF